MIKRKGKRLQRVLTSDDPFHIFGHGFKVQSFEDIVVEGGVVLAGSFAVGRKGDLQ